MIVTIIISNFPFEKVHVEAAAKIAKISRENGVSRFIHVSALNADKNSKSKFFRSKVIFFPIYPSRLYITLCT